MLRNVIIEFLFKIYFNDFHILVATSDLVHKIYRQLLWIFSSLLRSSWMETDDVINEFNPTFEAQNMGNGAFQNAFF